jgi:hypothetical protein
MFFDNEPRFNPNPIVRREVAHFIRPFNPGAVFVEISSSVVLRDPVIHVSSSTFTDDIFVMDGRELYLMRNDINELAAYVGVRAGQYFVSRMDEPVPDNVHLGEN